MMTETTDGALHSIGVAARLLGVSTKTLERWERDGKITGTRTVGGHRRFPQSEIDRLLGVEASA